MLLHIALSGTIILAFSEMLLAVITGLLTQHDTAMEFLQGKVFFKEDFFIDNPMLYFVLIYVSPLTYDGVVLWGSIFLYNIHLIGYLALHKCGAL